MQHKPGVQTQLQDVSDDSRWLWYRSNDIKKDSYAIYRYDLAARKAEAVFTDDGLWVLDDVADDGKLLLRKSTGSLSSEIYEYDPARRALTPLIGQDEKEEYHACYGAAPGSVLVRTNKPGEFRRLYRLERASRALVPITDEIKADVVSARLDRRRTRILYEVNDGGFFRTRALDARTFKPVALPELPTADNVYAGATSPSGRFTTVGVDDGAHPLRSFVIDWQRGKAEPWHLPSTPEIDTTQFVRAKLESYPARDGSAIPALVRSPARCARELCPVVVHFHGGPEAQVRPASTPRRSCSSTPASSSSSPTSAAATATARPGSAPTTARSA